MFARLLVILVAVFPCCVGCIPVAFVYPKVTFVPPTTLAPAEQTVRVFRVEESGFFAVTGFMCGCIDCGGTRSITEVTPSDGKHVPAQGSLSLERRLFWFPVYRRSRSSTMAIKLYRPGYQAVELPSWPSADPVIWREAADLPARMAALDAVWGCTSGDDDPRPSRCAYTAASAPALLFLASEYDRLTAEAEKQAAGSASTNEEADKLLERLRKRAVHLRSEAGALGKAAH